MKKKILAICIIGMFILTGFTTFSLAKNITTKYITSENGESSSSSYIAKADIYVAGLVGGASALIWQGAPFLSAGTWKASYRLRFVDLASYARIESGVANFYCVVAGKTFFLESFEFEYSGDNAPPDIEDEVEVYIPNTGLDMQNAFVRCSYSYLFYHGDVFIDKVEGKDEAQSTFYFSKEKTLNTPFLHFLQNHPYLFSIFRQLLRL